MQKLKKNDLKEKHREILPAYTMPEKPQPKQTTPPTHISI